MKYIKKLKIGIIVPSKGRPQGLEKHINSYISNAVKSEDINFYCYLDEDEKDLDKYKLINDKFVNLSITSGPPNNFSKAINLIAMQAYKEKCDLIIFGNDDVFCQTNKWDIVLSNNFNSLPKHKIGCFLLKSNSKCKWAFPAVTRSWIKNVGCFSPGIFNFFFHDTWIFDISQRSNCVYEIDSINLYHAHNEFKFAGFLTADSTYFKNNLNLFLRILRKVFGKKKFPSKLDLDQIIFDQNKKDRIKISKLLIKNMKI